MVRAIQPTFLNQNRGLQRLAINLFLLLLVTLTPVPPPTLSLFSLSSLGLFSGQTTVTQPLLVNDGYPFTRKLPWLASGKAPMSSGLARSSLPDRRSITIV